MIHVKRPPSSIPSDWAGKAAREREANIRALADSARGAKYTFEAYGEPELRFALNELFKFKCAYCESSYGATQPVAVEHYRPKAMVTEGKKKLPGYPWLAAEWSNLLPSCTDCNSRRNHAPPGQPKFLRGKGNEFPLADPKKRARRPAQVAREDPLLLHPSIHDPNQHLEFGTTYDTRGMVRPKVSRGKESALGKTSIEVYGLDRPGLIKERRDHASRIYFLMIELKEIATELEATPRNAGLKRSYDRHMAELQTFMESATRYAGMARQIIKEQFA